MRQRFGPPKKQSKLVNTFESIRVRAAAFPRWSLLAQFPLSRTEHLLGALPGRPMSLFHPWIDAMRTHAF